VHASFLHACFVMDGLVLLLAIATQETAGWVVLAVATVLAATGFLLQYLVPGRRLRTAGVSTSTILVAAAVAVVGFFVVPVVGAFLGFALGIYLMERIRLGAHPPAWRSTRAALTAIALSVGIELVTALAIASTWVVAVLTTP